MTMMSPPSPAGFGPGAPTPLGIGAAEQQQLLTGQLPVPPAPPPLGSGVMGACPAGFVETIFYPEEVPLGLIIDWSMAFPVVSSIAPGSPASERPELQPKLLMIMANKVQVKPGTSRQQVEEMLSKRPLVLVFEKPPDVTALDETSRNCLLKRRQHRAAVEEEAFRQTKEACMADLTLKERQALMSGVDLTGLPFFEQHPERSPLSRFGSLEVAPPHPAFQRTRAKMLTSVGFTPHGQHQESGKLPQLANVASDSMLGASMSSTWSSGGMRSTAKWRTGNARPSSLKWSGIPKAEGSDGRSPAVASRTSLSRSAAQLASVEPQPDMCYEHLLRATSAPCGPGPPVRWPLGHDNGYVCRFSDMVLVSKISAAYEVGFRGWKRDKPSEVQVLFPEQVCTPRLQNVVQAVEATCDTCGKFITDQDASSPVYFWYCRRCKKNGRRHELCPACHASEVLNGEGKHQGSQPHPHFQRCEHRSLVKYTDLRAAYPGRPHLKRAFCDFCGLLFMGQGDGPRAKGMQTVAPTGTAQLPGNSRPLPAKLEIYVCLRCFEDTDTRFELCAGCAFALQHRGSGIQQLFACR
mmetsp:Transcript_114866/g.245234  ORF Transcript_114866/g.245234 Transcript_114866/m.245234 type:complete len:579 (+) Transcript_114866:55-1791(+)